MNQISDSLGIPQESQNLALGIRCEIPLQQRNEWEDWIARDKADITRLTAEIKANEGRITAIVYELFDLTSEEIELLEANI